MALRGNIAILTPTKASYSETFISNHIERLPFDVTVIYGGYFPWKCDADQDNSKSELFWNLADIAGRKRGGVPTYRKKRLAALLKKFRIDLVLAEYIVTGSQVWKLCKELGIPLIATGLGYDLSKTDVLEKYAEDYRAYARYASHTIVVAEDMKTILEGYGVPESKITWSPAGPADEFFDLTPTLESKDLLVIGRFVEKKAPHLSLLAYSQVASRHPESRMLMAGDGDLLSVCKDIAMATGIDSQVDFLGRIDQEEQRRLLSSSRAFVQHSRTAVDGDMEGTPVAILEASAAGLPILSTRHSGIPGIVQDGITGLLVDEGDVDAMARQMDLLLSDRAKAKELGDNGKHLVKERFTLRQHIDAIASCIEAAIVPG